jgi:hypothetical protein
MGRQMICSSISGISILVIINAFLGSSKLLFHASYQHLDIFLQSNWSIDEGGD